MKAYIKKEKWEEFKKDYVNYSFTLALNPNYYIKNLGDGLILYISRRKRELHLIAGMGESPFMEVHTQYYLDLFDNGFIEYIKGEFD